MRMKQEGTKSKFDVFMDEVESKAHIYHFAQEEIKSLRPSIYYQIELIEKKIEDIQNDKGHSEFSEGDVILLKLKASDNQAWLDDEAKREKESVDMHSYSTPETRKIKSIAERQQGIDDRSAAIDKNNGQFKSEDSLMASLLEKPDSYYEGNRLFIRDSLIIDGELTVGHRSFSLDADVDLRKVERDAPISIPELPRGMHFLGALVTDHRTTKLPDNLKVACSLTAKHIDELPKGLFVGATLMIDDAKVRSIPPDSDIRGNVLGHTYSTSIAIIPGNEEKPETAHLMRERGEYRSDKLNAPQHQTALYSLSSEASIAYGLTHRIEKSLRKNPSTPDFSKEQIKECYSAVKDVMTKDQKYADLFDALKKKVEGQGVSTDLPQILQLGIGKINISPNGGYSIGIKEASQVTADDNKELLRQNLRTPTEQHVEEERSMTM